MRGATFVGSLAFAVVAGLAAVAGVLLTGPVLGRSLALALCAAASVVLYLLTIAPSWGAGVRAAALAAVAIAMLSVALPMPGAILLGVGAALAVIRSGLLHRSTPGRSLVIEVGLVSVGLAFARGLYGPGHLDPGLAVWGFFLVQSLFFLVGERARSSSQTEADPFEHAVQRMQEVLDRA